MEPWRTRLEAGDSDAAWTLFLARYHRLIGATISRLSSDNDDAHDIFADVCERLARDDLARLRRFQESGEHRAKFSTWLVVVVRNLAIDWLRARDGRPRAAPPGGLTPLRERIYQVVLVERRSHVEAYEELRDEVGTLSFAEFVREIAVTYRAVDARRWLHLALLHEDSRREDGGSEPAVDEIEQQEERTRLAAAMAQLGEKEREAVRLFVIEERPASEVAQMVGWPNAKAVYNRVSRALASLRSILSADAPPRRPPS